MKSKKNDQRLFKRFEERIEKEHQDVRLQQYINTRGYHPNLSILAINGHG
ncbi:MAG: hypothetical protein ACOWWR_06370 [Eubacteriales bacterium]